MNYLCLPLDSDSSKAKFWKPIIDKIQGRLALLKGTLLSKASRAQLIKYVLNNLPTFYLSVFKFPDKIESKQLVSIGNSFGEVRRVKRLYQQFVGKTWKNQNLWGLGFGNIKMKNLDFLNDGGSSVLILNHFGKMW